MFRWQMGSALGIMWYIAQIIYIVLINVADDGLSQLGLRSLLQLQACWWSHPDSSDESSVCPQLPKAVAQR